MHTNELLEEVWAIKDELAREADYDIRKYCENLRRFSESQHGKNPARQNQNETRRLERRGDVSSPAVREDAPKYGDNEA